MLVEPNPTPDDNLSEPISQPKNQKLKFYNKIDNFGARAHAMTHRADRHETQTQILQQTLSTFTTDTKPDTLHTDDADTTLALAAFFIFFTKKNNNFFFRKNFSQFNPFYVHFRPRFFSRRFSDSLLPELQNGRNLTLRRTHKFNPSITKDPDRLGNPERLNTLKIFFGFFFKKKTIFGYHRDKMIPSALNEAKNIFVIFILTNC